MNTPKRILVIDDEPHLRQVLVDTLTYLGYETVTANDGQRGLELAIECAPDLIIADVVMPRMDGYELLERIRMNAATQSIPVIFLSGAGEYQAKRHFLRAGASKYMPKPFIVEELLSAVQTQLIA